ncbi:uncharacterized protein A1O5_12907 [Cladophialophora psammophila CBS 110553]|uniref:Cytochrome P450 oxidoreductase n=1 Tax=Cladophialophora psammophila CBS 110553 TaxID=1182543 RepID=W9VRT5_9EURO|nr:uncharacterized protein A1O5_12907 [Cladophialophora psammophila CBS 110553]EXJ54841.1 hypothetical protein A1O5_12907 [Cladophialophora psammophila CBS 110553]
MAGLSFSDQLKARMDVAEWPHVCPRQIYLLIPVVFLLAVFVYRAVFHPLARIPGPTLAAVTGNWRNYHYFAGTWHKDILDLHRRYGRVVRIAPNEVSVVDAAALKQLYGHGTSAIKTSWYDVWTIPGAGPAFFAVTNPHLHGKLRKRVSAAYSMSAILRYEQYIQSCLDLCMWKFKTFADEGRVEDLAEWLTALAFDIVGEIAYGKKFGHLKTGKDVFNMRGSIAKAFYLMANSGHFWGQLFPINNSLIQSMATMLGGKNPLVEMQRYAEGRVNARKQGKDEVGREDMLAHFVRMKSLDGTGLADQGEVLVEAMNIIGAGADTTSVGMSACLYYLGMHPDAYNRLQADVNKFYESENLSAPITYHQTQQIPFLKAVVMESLRLFPSIMYQLLRISPGIVIDKKYIPAGYDIGISPMAQNRDQAVYGPDANEFRPERWLQSDEIVATYERYNMTFGGNGPRTCVGKNIALVEIHKLVAQLLYNFDFELVDKEHPWHVFTFWFAHTSKMNVRLSVRPGRKIEQPSD